VITDGPYVEGKEVISGFAEIDVADLDEALRLVKTWPGCPLVEIRPIAAVRAEAPTWTDTDWQQILVLYTMLDGLAPSPVTKLHRAIALRYTAGPAAALSEVDTLAGVLDGYHLWHATHAELLRDPRPR